MAKYIVPEAAGGNEERTWGEKRINSPNKTRGREGN